MEDNRTNRVSKVLGNAVLAAAALGDAAEMAASSFRKMGKTLRRRTKDPQANTKMEDIRRGRQVVGKVAFYMAHENVYETAPGQPRHPYSYRWCRRNLAKLRRRDARVS